MDDFRNTSYLQEYIVVSQAGGTVVLRPVAEALLDTYWKEFISAEARGQAPVSLSLTAVPPAVRSVDVNGPIALDYPSVVLLGDGKAVDLSKMVTANLPSDETPGLYRIEYRLPLPGVGTSVIWASYLSIEEPPVLRRTITPWNRGSYTLQSLTRLALEPQFQEALYEEGAPLYNFMTANMPPALRPSGARECFQCFGVKAGGHLFVSGHRLPLASSVEIGDLSLGLDRAMLPGNWSVQEHSAHSVVYYAGRAYCSTAPVGEGDVPGASPKWVAGGYYSLAGDTEGWEKLPDGPIQLSAVWAPVDLRGYTFRVNVREAPRLGTYWGLYHREYFPDYKAGDIVSYISNGTLYLYRRNDTDIRDLGTEEAYRPGHYQNPHWDEVYADWQSSELRALGRWIQPISNAGNAVIAKTGTLSEDVCSIYARLLGIPETIIDAVGSKGSVALYMLLQRTRNTFEGFQAAFRAMGFDVSDLHRVYDTVPASDAAGEPYNVYGAAEALRALVPSIQQGHLWRPKDPSEPFVPDYTAGDAPWVRYYPDPRLSQGRGEYQIQKYVDGRWVTVYQVDGFGDEGGDIKGNNRYYRATLSVLDRMAKQALVDMGDGKQWIGLNSFSPISSWLLDVERYEVPVYIYLSIQVYLASVDDAWAGGIGQKWFQMAAYGGTAALVVHPLSYFDLASGAVQQSRASVQCRAEGGPWADREPDTAKDGSDVYYFHTATDVRFVLEEGAKLRGYWTSRHTNGLLGDLTAEPAVDASELGAQEVLTVANGVVAVTPMADMGALRGSLRYLKYNYILSADGAPWQLDGTTPFGGYVEGPEVSVLATWPKPLDAFFQQIAAVKGGRGEELTWAVDADLGELLVFDSAPGEIYIYGAYRRLVAVIHIPSLPYVVGKVDAYIGGEKQPILKLKLEKE